MNNVTLRIYRKCMLAFVVFVFNSGLANAQLSGNYTIDPHGSGSRNYLTIRAAVTALSTGGVSAPVVFTLSADTFKEYVQIPAVIGASASSTISFIGQGMNSTYIIKDTSHAAVYLFDADHIIIKNLTIDDPNIVGTSIFIDNNADSNMVENCRLRSTLGSYNIGVYVLGSSYNVFKGCEIIGGEYATYVVAYYPNFEKGNSFINNDISGYNTYTFYYNYQTGFEIRGNYAHGSVGQYGGGFYAYYTADFDIIGNNLVDLCGYSIYYYSYGVTNPDSNRIYNNMFSVARGADYLIYMSDFEKTLIYNNSFYHASIDGGPKPFTGVSLYTGGSGNALVNNTFSVRAAYYGMEIYGFDELDYNNYYIFSDQYFVYDNGFYNTFNDWKAANTAYNQHSKFGDPEFVSPSNLHVSSVQLNNSAKRLPQVTTDIDGQTRPLAPDVVPDIGADEYYLAPNDMDVVSLDSPEVLRTGLNTLAATFRNSGTNTLTNFYLKVGYSTNGGSSYVEDSFFITSIAPGVRMKHSFATKWNVSSSGSYNVCIRISKQVTGDPDPEDKICKNICTGISGNFVIDRAGSGNYLTFAAAIASLECGIIGNVNFTVKGGVYNENVEIPRIKGSSASAKVTFDGGSIDSVTINAASGEILRLKDADYVTFRNMKLLGNPNANGVHLLSGATNNIIENLWIDLNNSFNYNVYGVVIGTDASTGSATNINNTIKSNYIRGAYGGIAVNGSSSTSRPSGNKLLYNTIRRPYEYGIYFTYNSGLVVEGNTVDSFASSFGYGIYAYNNVRSMITKNFIKGAPYMVMYMDYENNDNSSSSDTSYLTNNMFGGGMIYPYGGYGLYSYFSQRIKFYNNSINADNQAYYAWYCYGASNWDVLNNNIAFNSSQAGGYAIYWDYSTAINFDYNNYDNNSSNGLVYWLGTTYQDLAAWKGSATGFNQHSTAVDANFISMTDLHLKFSNSFPRGRKNTVTVDVDDDPRCVFAPSVGADESIFPVPPPHASFLAPDTVYVNNEVTFLNGASKKDELSYEWYVDNTFESTDLHFKSQFKSIGTHTVKLLVFSCSGTDSMKRTFIVANPVRKPAADFMAEPTTAITFDEVKLRDLSKYGAQSWKWLIMPDSIFDPLYGQKFETYYFTDGDFTSQNPNITFQYPGKYDVCLVASNAFGTDTLCATDYIEILNTANMCIAPFESSDPNGILYDDGGPIGQYGSGHNSSGTGFCYYNINSCVGTVRLNMDFFDLRSGDYLRVYDGYNSAGVPLWDAAASPKGMTGDNKSSSFKPTLDALSGRMYIEFESDNNNNGAGFIARWTTLPRTFIKPVANYSAPDTACAGIPVYFHNTTTGNFAQYRWYVGTSSSLQGNRTDFEYTWKAPGIYTVKMLAENCGGLDSVRKTIVIEDAAKKPAPDFEASELRPRFGDLVTLFDRTTYCASELTWTITPSTFVYVNGTNEHSRNPEVLFTDAGYYSVKLMAENPYGTDSMTKPNYIFVVSTCKPSVASLNADLGISRVKVGDIDNVSEIGVEEYTNYSSTKQTMLFMGFTYDVSLERITTNNAMSRAVWIDYNQDGDFDDVGELVVSETNAHTQSYTGSFTVPLTALPGSTILRVGTNRGNSANLPCGPNQFGEYEDYKVILVEDKEIPVITRTGSDTVHIEQCRSYAELGATAMDNVDGDLTSFIQTTGTVDTCLTGNYTISYDVQDQSGNQAITVHRTVVVVADTTDPILTLNQPLIDTIEVGTVYIDPGYSATDNVDGNLTSSVQTAGAVNHLIVGVYNLVYSLADAHGNVATAQRTVYVLDRTNPSISLKGKANDTVSVNTTWVDPGVNISDNYDDVSELTLTVTGTVDATTIGIYNITYCVSDSSGNGPVCIMRTVIVNDLIKPVVDFQTPNDSFMVVEVFTQFNDPGLKITDNDQAFIQSVGGTWPGNTNTIGTYTIIYTIADPSGNTAMITRKVQVVDRTAPVLSVNQPLLDTVFRWSTYTDPGYTVVDNYYPLAQLTVHRMNTLDMLMPGIYTISYQAEDPSGNLSPIIQRTVVVVDFESGINDPIGGEIAVNIYPNPTNGRFTIDLKLPEREQVKISVLNMLGEEVARVDEASVQDAVYNVNLSGMRSGVYFVRIMAGEQAITRKVVLSNR